MVGAALLSQLSLAPANAQSYGGSYSSGSGNSSGYSYGNGHSSNSGMGYGYGSNMGSGNSHGKGGGYGSGGYGSGGYGSGGYGSGSYGSGGYGSGGYGSGSYGYSNTYAYGKGGFFYVIQPGDTLAKIAARFGTTIGALLRANPYIKNPDLIYAGRLLFIPNVSYAGGYGAGGYGYAAPMTPYAAPAAPYAPPAPAPAPAPPPSGQTIIINLSAQNMAFSLSTITVPAGAHVVINFTNLDPIPHDVAVYTDSSAQQLIFRGQIITGPNAKVAYSFTAPSQPGTYFFRCEVHPTIMMGQFVVH